MRRIVLLVAIAVFMAMVIAGPAQADISGGGISVGGGGSSSFGNTGGLSNTSSVVLVGNDVGIFDVDDGVDFGFVDGVDVDFDNGVDVSF